MTETPAVIRQEFGGRKHEPYTESRNSPRAKNKARDVKSKVRFMLLIFFDIKGISYKEFILTENCV
jgi:hypothetical protein